MARAINESDWRLFRKLEPMMLGGSLVGSTLNEFGAAALTPPIGVQRPMSVPSTLRT